MTTSPRPPFSLPRIEGLALSGADGRAAAIIEMGTKLTRCGFAGEFHPRAIIRTELPDGRCPFDDRLVEGDRRRVLIQFIRLLFFRYLLSPVKDRRVVIVESVLCPTQHRQDIARALFEVLQAPSLLFAPSHLMATFPFAVKTSLVVDIGYKEAVVVPVAEGVVLLNNWEVSMLGARTLESTVLAMLKRDALIEDENGHGRVLNEKDVQVLNELRIVEDVCLKLCYVTTLNRARQWALNNGEQLQMIADIKIPLRNEFLVIPGRVREFAAEVLFAEDGDIQSLPQLILDCVLRCPVDLRRKMLESLVVIGGLAQLNGLLSRLKDELKDHLENSYKEKLHGKTVRFYRYKETQLELYASWKHVRSIGIALVTFDQSRGMAKNKEFARLDNQD